MPIIFVFLSNFVLVSGILLSSFYILKKAIRYPATVGKTAVSIIWCVTLALFYAVNPFNVTLPMLRLLSCAASTIFIVTITRQKPDTIIAAYWFSFASSNILLYIASFIVSVITYPLIRDVYTTLITEDYNRPIFLLVGILTLILQLFLSYLLFRIRRFRNGFPFLFKGYAVILALIVVGAVLILTTWASRSYNAYEIILYVAGILTIGIGIYILIRRGISVFQWRKTMLRNIELLESELAGEKGKNERLMAQLEVAQSATHKILQRLEAMELKVARQSGSKISGDFVTVKDIQKLQWEYQEDIARIKGRKKLPSTKIKEIDNMFELFAQKFAGSDIDFNLKVSGSILYMVEHVIEQTKLETMIGDHLQDALIAVNGVDNPNRSVLAIIGLVGEHYEFTVFDSGIPFEADTLARLGVERVTTHAATGGSGIGFMTTFEAMRECNASLIIDEKEPSSPCYSKSVTIKFDGKNQYIIKTHRPENIPENDRYLVISNAEQQ